MQNYNWTRQSCFFLTMLILGLHNNFYGLIRILSIVLVSGSELACQLSPREFYLYVFNVYISCPAMSEGAKSKKKPLTINLDSVSAPGIDTPDAPNTGTTLNE